MIRDSVEILNSLTNYANPDMKLKRMVEDKTLYRLRRGMYATDKNIAPYLLAGAIYGPSYVSFETALSLHGLIPERVFGCTSATYDKNRSKVFRNEIGTFYYRDVPKAIYYVGVKWQQENGMGYALATPEKAICDMLYIQKPVFSKKALKELLFDDLRINEEDLRNLDATDIVTLAPYYKKRNLLFLSKIMEERRCV